MSSARSLRRRLCFGACLATVATSSAAGGADASVLVQSLVQKHGEARKGHEGSAGLGGVLDAAFMMLGKSLLQPAADAGSQPPPGWVPEARQTIELTRTMEETETGAYVALMASRSGCEDCPFTWGDTVDLLSVVHVPSTVQEGDKVAVTINLGMEVGNDDPYLKTILSEPLTIHGFCGICGGSCHFESARGLDTLAMTTPTLVLDTVSCHGNGKPKDNVTDIVVLDKSMVMPFDYYALQLTGHLNVSMTAMREENALATSTVSLMVKPQTALPKKKAMNLARSPEDAPALPSFMETMLGPLLNAADSSTQLGVNLAREVEEIEPKGATTVNAVVTNLLVHSMENSGRNISVYSEGNCATNDDLGSVGCVHKIGEKPDKVTTTMHLDSYFEPGSYMIIKVEPKFEGPVGQIKRFIDYMTIGQFEVPLCGEESVEFEYRGELKRYKPPPCGHYSLDLKLLAKEVRVPLKVRVPAMQVFDKFLAVNKFVSLNLFSPMSLDVNVQMFHPANVPILDVELNMALERM